jgi:F0F1-type ATP synthase delta subunit
MKLSRRVIARYVAGQLIEGNKSSNVMRTLAAFIVENHRQKEVDFIVRDIMSNLSRSGYVQATVTSARALGPELKEEVERFIRNLEEASQVDVHEVVDSSLLGGVIIETAEKRFDASVATTLKRLRNA